MTAVTTKEEETTIKREMLIRMPLGLLVTVLVVLLALATGGATWVAGQGGRIDKLETGATSTNALLTEIRGELRLINETGAMWTRSHFELIEQQFVHFGKAQEALGAAQKRQWELLRAIDRKLDK